MGKAAKKIFMERSVCPKLSTKDLGLTANAIYQIRDRMKKRLAEEVEKLKTDYCL